MLLRLYRGLTGLGAPLISAYLNRRLRRGKEDALRFGERKGLASQPRPAGKLVWIHGASVGETLSLLPLVEQLVRRPGLSVLVTSGTVTSAQLMAERLPSGAFHHYVPVDRLPWVRRFLDHWKPDLALWCESELWPNLLMESAARKVPLVLLNGRMSERSYARWRKHPRLIGQLLSCFGLCMAQTEADARRLYVLGAARVICRGNLKFAGPPPPVDDAALEALDSEVGDRPRWLLASSHPAEEAMAGRAHQALAASHPGLLTIVVPRHPQRGPEIAEELRAVGLKVALRSAGESLEADTEILLADTLGEMGLFIRLAPLVMMGKSLIGQGGQNPLEPARLSAAVLFGPHMGNFADIARRMIAAGGAAQVDDEEALAKTLGDFLDHPAKAAEMGRCAEAFAAAEAGVLDAVLAELEPWLSHSGRPS